MISVRFQGKPFNITVIQVYAPTSNTEAEWFYEDLQDLPELKPKKDVLFIIRSFQIRSVTQSCPTLCKPMNNMKRQNDRILKEELPRSVGAQHATGDQ